METVSWLFCTIVAMSDAHFDDEFARAFTEIAELRKTIAALNGQVESLEKRELLRVRSNQFCRACHERETRTGAPPNPPISELERKYHEADHALSSAADPSLGRSAFGARVSWDDVERQVEQCRSKRG
jgi:cytochrome c553